MNGFSEKISIAARWITESERHVVFTGAGVSTESGIPDFRGPDGVWTRREKGLPPPQVDWSSIEPNPAHKAIASLQDMGKLEFLISQNVDNLHLRSGISPENMAELHGNRTLMRCMSCGRKFKKREVNWDDAKWGKGYRTSPVKEGQPNCPVCDGRLVSSVVNFGDPLPSKELNLAIQHSKKCDLFTVIGSSLVVYPAADMPRYALESGAKLILINKGRSAMDDLAHLRLEGKAGEIVPRIVRRVNAIL